MSSFQLSFIPFNISKHLGDKSIEQVCKIPQSHEISVIHIQINIYHIIYIIMYYESFNRYFVSSFSKGVNVVLINSTHIKKETLIFKVRNFIGLH